MINRNPKLSNVTKEYLAEYRRILDRMIECMTTVELTDSISHNFIVQMIPHHNAAIEMSKNLLRYTTNINLQNIASNIISTQTKSIEDMCEIKDECSMCCNSQCDVSNYQDNMDVIIRRMIRDMKNAPISNDINVNFINEMIPHHRGAIQMANNTLRYSICNELRSILNNIIRSQSTGIRQMRYLLKCMK